MTAVVFLSLAGGLGATARFVLDAVIRARVRWAFPVGTALINVSGSLLLGFLTGLADAHVVPEIWRLVAGTGFLGGYTTFSTASFETARLFQEGRHRAALLNGLGVLVAAAAAALLGFALGSRL